MARKTRSGIRAKRQVAKAMSLEQGEEYEVHHRHPRSRKRSYPGKHINEERNLSILRRVDHIAWHTLVKNELPPEFVKRLNEEFMPPDWYLQAQPRGKSSPRFRRGRRFCTDCQCEVLRHIPTVRRK